MKRIIYLRSTSIINDSRATKEIDAYIENGCKVIVLGWDRQRIINKPETISQNMKVLMCKLESKYGNGIKNINKYIKFQIWLYKNLTKYKDEYDIIHACDYDTASIAYKIAKKYNKKIIYDIYDYYVDCHNLSFLKKIIEKKDINIINNADSVIICTEQRKKQICKSNPKKTIVIHNTPNINLKTNNCRKFNTEKIKICYIGILQDERLLIEIAEQLKNNKKYELHIGGFGKYEEYFKELSNSTNNIHFYGQLKYEEVLKLENECDILFATYNPDVPNHRYSAPNKVYEAMALGKPIIVCKNTGVDELVVKEKIGYAIKYDANDFIKKIDIITKSDYKEISEKSKKLYLEEYSWNKMKERLIKNIERM